MKYPSPSRFTLTLGVVTLCLLVWMITPSISHAQGNGATGTSTPKEEKEERTGGVFQILKDGGVIGFVIILLSMVSLGFIIEHALTIRKQRLMPLDAADDLEKMVKNKKIVEAIKYCQDPDNDSLLTRVILAGLLRFRASEFGFAEYRSAVEEAGEEQTAKLYRKTEILSVIGGVAPMMGLLGTVQGMIGAFNKIASTGGAAKPDVLAGDISTALVTTMEGLVVAIPTLAALSFFRTRIDSLVAETGKRVEQILLPLGRQK